jgi:hypothetical protein
MRRLHTVSVQLPDPRHLSPRVELDPKLHQFNGCLGAIDGTLIRAHIPIEKQKRFWSRKGLISQNVFLVVSFEGLYLYVLAGAEGSFHDASVFLQAITRDFMIPSGRMYLADAGFGTRRGVILPFPLQRYHLQDWRYADRPPETKEELFNLRHSRLRVGVEQTIGLDKRKWKIIRCSAPEYRFRDQIALIYVVTGLHNFIKL